MKKFLFALALLYASSASASSFPTLSSCSFAGIVHHVYSGKLTPFGDPEMWKNVDPNLDPSEAYRQDYEKYWKKCSESWKNAHPLPEDNVNTSQASDEKSSPAPYLDGTLLSDLRQMSDAELSAVLKAVYQKGLTDGMTTYEPASGVLEVGAAKAGDNVYKVKLILDPSVSDGLNIYFKLESLQEIE